ncbi:MAG: transcription elongation factor Spt5 [Thermoplasmata archaeon]|nr:transcription elongation factor Spt5 [Thermoplasmata archaeon]
MSLLEGLKNEETEQTAKPPESALPPQELRKIKITCEGEEKRSITTGITSDYNLKIVYEGSKADKLRLSVTAIHDSSLGEAGAEWVVVINMKDQKPWEVTRTGLMDKEMDIQPNQTIPVTLRVTAPKGARYGDAINVVINVASVQDPALSDSMTTRTTARQSVLAIKTQIGHEKTVADTLAVRAKDLGVLSILSPAPLRGYVLIEAMNSDRLEEVVRSVKRARGIVGGEMKLEEIEHYLTPKALVSGIVEGDIVELVAGPFKGEKARVQHIDEGKEEITVELFEALVPIPVTVKGDSVRVIGKEK